MYLRDTGHTGQLREPEAGAVSEEEEEEEEPARPVYRPLISDIPFSCPSQRSQDERVTGRAQMAILEPPSLQAISLPNGQNEDSSIPTCPSRRELLAPFGGLAPSSAVRLKGSRQPRWKPPSSYGAKPGSREPLQQPLLLWG